MKRGSVKETKVKKDKQNLVTFKEVYDGEIHANYVGKPKYSINPKGERPFEIYSEKPLAQLRAKYGVKYPGCIVNPIKF